MKLPKIGYGAWKIGGERTADYLHDEEAKEAIRTALQLGYTHIDTAEVYAEGHCEELIGEVLKEFDREKIVITDKVSWWHLKHDEVIAACKQSLERLGIQQIDLYLIHGPDPNVPIAETMRAMDELVEQGLVKHIGVSNFSVKQLKEAQRHAKHKIVVNQVEYNPFNKNDGQYTKNVEKEVIPYCQENDIIIVAYRPLAKGNIPENELIQTLATKYDKTPAQIILNWIISKPGVVTIPKAMNPQHIKENWEAQHFEMSTEDLEKIDALEQ